MLGPYIEKKIVFGILIGILSGLAGVGFYYMVSLVARIVGYAMVSSYEGWTPDLSIYALNASNRVIILIVLPVAALISGLIVYRFAPEAEGPGVDPTIEAYHHMRKLHLHLPVVKAVASSIMIGSGGSGGLQGPGLQIGGGIGYSIATILKLGLRYKRILMVAGMAGTLSAVFHSPIGAALFAVEVLYRRDIEVEGIVSSLISSITAYAVSTHIMGYTWLLPRLVYNLVELFAPAMIMNYIALAFLSAVFAWLYIQSFHTVKKLVSKAGISGIKRAAIPAAMVIPVAIIGYYVPYILGSGTGMLSQILVMTRNNNLDINMLGLGTAASLLLLVLLKILATSLSMGSGGSGGLFAPAVFIGGTLGLFYGIIMGSPTTGIPPYFFAYIGIASFFGAATNTPFATSFMVAEMSRDYYVLLPALISSLISNEIIRYDTLYRSQPVRRPPTILVTPKELLSLIDKNVLSNIKVWELTIRDKIVLDKNADLGKIREEIIRKYGETIIPIIVGDEFYGVIDLRRQAIKQDMPRIDYQACIIDALELMSRERIDYLVVTKGSKVIGVLTLCEIIRLLSSLIYEYQLRGFSRSRNA